MITIFDKGEIINLKLKGISNRQVAKIVGVDRKTIAKVWNNHLQLNAKLNTTIDDNKIRDIQNEIVAKPTYNSTNRKKRKFTKEMEVVVDELLQFENDKINKIGSNHKQHITNAMIHQSLIDKGFDIGISTISNIVREKRYKLKETFIRQKYELGQRLEFDFGEVKLLINDIYTKYYLAVLSAPASNYKVAYLYKSQDKNVFMDAHVRFFESIGGIYNEVVYDNMRNVVSKFIGRNKKQLNEDLVKMSMYYGFDINVTNCFSGNEKGHVEGSVKHIRKQAFSLKYEFDSLAQAQNHLEMCLIKINEKSSIEKEKLHLKAHKPKLELAEISKSKVSKYSLIRIDNNFYSVPEDLNGKEVIVKNYLNDIEVYYNRNLVCVHNKIDAYLDYVIDINHYLKTFSTKPGALANSQALANNPNLKSIYIKYYTKKPKLFIELISENKHLSKEELNEILLTSYNAQVKTQGLEDKIMSESSRQIEVYTNILKGVNNYGSN